MSIISVIGSADEHVRRYILYRVFGGSGFRTTEDLLAFLIGRERELDGVSKEPV